MNSKDLEVLKKIQTHANRIILHSKECKVYEDFAGSDLISDACIFNIMQIGELAKNELSDEIKQRISSIPWNNI